MADLIGIYRVSRAGDREEKGAGYHSPVEQVESSETWAAANGHRIVKWYDESGSVSGKTVDREGLQGALADVYAGMGDGIIVTKVDRLSREVVGGLMAVRDLQKAGKMFIAHKDGISGDDSEGSQMILMVLLWVAEWYLKSVTKGWRETTQRHIANGIHTAQPFGYRKDNYDRRLRPVADEVDWVVGAFVRRADAMSWGKIADWLNDNGLRTRQGNLWTVNPVRRMIQSRVYLGEVYSGDFVNTEAHEPIITLDLWTRANALNRTAQRREAAEFALTGAIRCCGCGVRMAGRSQKVGVKNPKLIRYYSCRRRFSFGNCPAPARIRADVIEAAVEEVFRERFLHPTCEAEGEASSEALVTALTEQEAAEAELLEFMTSEATIETGRVLGQSWVDEGQRFRLNRVLKAREAVNEARNAAIGVALPMNLAEVWDTLEVEEQRAFLTDAFEVIAVRREDAGGGFRIWTVNDVTAPQDLPGRGGASRITPISMDNSPSSPRDAAA
jgi:DNA invertase Pin-like site-specific DNA recombinase